MAGIPDEERCKRSDGKGWRCRLPVMAGNGGYCETHFQQRVRRQKGHSVPDHLKLDRTRRTKILPKTDEPLKTMDSISPSTNTEPDPNAALKEPVIYDFEEDVIDCDPEEEMNVSNLETNSHFDKSQQLHMIRQLLPVMTKINQEKVIELDTEAKNKGIRQSELQVQVARYPWKTECSFCKACIPDVHRSCNSCPYSMCIACCHEFRDGYLHLTVALKKTKMIRSKNTGSTSWKFRLDGSIRCPPKNLGGCRKGLLHLTSFYPFSLTKDLEESAKQILCKFQLKKQNRLSDSSQCFLCHASGEMGLYFSSKKDFKDNHLEHFMTHWGKGQPFVIRDLLQTEPDLDWDFGFILCEYLEKLIKSRNNTGTGSAESTSDRCEVEFGRKQIFSGGITYENVWDEFLKFKLQFSFDFLQDHFPDHYNAVIQSLPIQEYMNPYTGFMNLGAQSPHQTKNPNLGSYVSISYGGLDNPMDPNLLLKLCIHAYDVVNILVHASSRSIHESSLNEVKLLMIKYNSRVDSPNHEVVLTSDESESESESESDDEDLPQVGNTCGAHWDIFRREDVPMLLEYLRKYSNQLRRYLGSPRKLVHPLFDEVLYLNDGHKARLKEEFNVVALSFKQHTGEAVIIPAGCPYQVKKIKSCVNVVYEFMSPESALESIKVSDEVRLLPVNHKAKGNMVQVKKMAIDRMQATIEELCEVFVSQTEWSWPSLFLIRKASYIVFYIRKFIPF